MKELLVDLLGKPDGIVVGLALANALFVLVAEQGVSLNLSSSLVGLVSDVVGLVLRTSETRVDLERINLMSRRDSLVQFR